MATKFSEEKAAQESAEESRTTVDLEKIARGVRLILEGIGEDPDRSGLKDTPQRTAEMFA